MEEIKTEKIINKIFQERTNIIPIIGEEMFIYRDKDNNEISFQSFLVDKLENLVYFSNEDKSAFTNRQEMIEEMKKQGYYGMTLLYEHLMLPGDKDFQFKERLADIYRDNCSNIHLSSSLLEFLKVSKYPLIITTSPFDIIERDLGYNVKESLYYEKNNGCDSTIRDNENCVYHLFGPRNGIVSGNTEFVTNEHELMHFLHSIHQNPPTNLIEKIENKNLFVLGCCLPNWFFRFLLYPIKNKSKVYLFSNDNSPKELDYYLHCIGYDRFKCIDYILESLSNKIHESELENERYDVFLSIASEDVEIATILKKQLEDIEDNCKIKVWLYTEEPIYGQWTQKIKDAFNASRFFMPLITPQYYHKFVSKDRTERSKISGLEKCLKDFAIPKIEREFEKGNFDYVIPIIIEDTLIEEDQEDDQELTIDLFVSESKNKYCPVPKFFSQGIQFYKYNKATKDGWLLKDSMEEKSIHDMKEQLNIK